MMGPMLRAGIERAPVVWSRARAAVAILAALGCIGASARAAGRPTSAVHGPAHEGTVTVQMRFFTAHLRAYGEVRPIALVPIRAAEPGAVSDLRVVPGSSVRAGESLGKLAGPEIHALLVQREGAVHSARAQLAAARRTLAIERRQLAAQLSTLQSIAIARRAVAAGEAAVNAAVARLRGARALRTLRAPSAGTVIAIDAGNGERIAVGQTILTLEPSHHLWLKATYYGTDAARIRVGMRGRFRPASGAAPVAVKVAAVASALTADGGESVGLVPARAAKRKRSSGHGPWVSGERGTVLIAGATRRRVWVPTRALILDRARWWVLVLTPNGVRRRQVVPGATRGWQTVIDRGLRPGQQVVVRNAFLEFHRGIAKRYTPPD